MGPVSAAAAMALFFAVLTRAGWRPGRPTGPGTALHHAYTAAVATTFLAIVAGQIGVAFAARTERSSLRSVGVLSNRWLLGGIGFECAVAAFVVATPGVQGVFGTALPPWWVWPALAPLPVLVWGVDEVYRAAGRRRHPPTADRAGRGTDQGPAAVDVLP